MQALKTTVLEVVILGAVALVVGFTANGVRAARKRLDFTKNHFDRGLEKALAAKTAALVQPDEPGPSLRSGPASPVNTDADAHAEHGYQTISFAEVAEVFRDPNTATGANAFIDARSEETYADGHIPDAIQADHYRIDEYIDKILLYTQGAEKVIVYCNGGDCEDSILMCGDLLDAGLPYDAIFLFAGGWTEWIENDMPTETGPDPHVSEDE